MTCPVCGYSEVEGVCARCGTDLLALAGEGGEARLEVVAVTEDRPPRKASQ